MINLTVTMLIIPIAIMIVEVIIIKYIQPQIRKALIGVTFLNCFCFYAILFGKPKLILAVTVPLMIYFIFNFVVSIYFYHCDKGKIKDMELLHLHIKFKFLNSYIHKRIKFISATVAVALGVILLIIFL